MVVFLSYRFRLSNSLAALPALRCGAVGIELRGQVQFPGMRWLHLGHAPSTMRFCKTLCQERLTRSSPHLGQEVFAASLKIFPS